MTNPLPSLPLEVVERIQHFMDYKTAAGSATLCSQLHDSWRTMTNIDIDQRLFNNVGDFWVVANKTIERYRESNQKIWTLTIWVGFGLKALDTTIFLMNEAVKLGAHEINLRIYDDVVRFKIPGELFSCQQLKRISVTGGALDVSAEIPVCCTSIRSMTLLPNRYIGYGGDLLNNYVMKCPYLEKLECSGCMLWFSKSKLGNLLHTLLSLTVVTLNVQDRCFFEPFIHTFPRLISLTVKDIYGIDTIEISGESIQRISIQDQCRAIDVAINAPNLRKLYIDSTPWSSATFQSPICGLVVDLSVVCTEPNPPWFTSLYKLLKSLSSTKLRVTVRVVRDNPEFIAALSVYHALGKAIDVEKLELKTVGPTPMMVECLYRVCMPVEFFYELKTIH